MSEFPPPEAGMDRPRGHVVSEISGAIEVVKAIKAEYAGQTTATV